MNNEERINSHIGEIYGDYIITGFDRVDGKILYTAKCKVCGHIVHRPIAELRNISHKLITCKEDFLIHLDSIKNSDYKFEYVSDRVTNKGLPLYVYKCKICGHELLLNADSIMRYNYNHSFVNCGEHVYLDEVGKVYDDYKIIGYLGKREKNTRGDTPIYLCECQVCRRQKIMQISNIKQYKGTTHNSCSLLLDRSNLPYIDKFEKKWADLRTRTTSVKSDHYDAYGGRGISSDAFRYFIDFFDAMYPSFLDHVAKYGIDDTTIERIDVNGDYCPENCTWVTRQEQFDNKQDTIYFSATDESGNISYHKNLAKYCRESEFEYRDKFNIFNRLNGIVQNSPVNGYLYQRISKEEYEQNINKIQICRIVSDEEAKELLKKMKEENDNV